MHTSLNNSKLIIFSVNFLHLLFNVYLSLCCIILQGETQWVSSWLAQSPTTEGWAEIGLYASRASKQINCRICSDKLHYFNKWSDEFEFVAVMSQQSTRVYSGQPLCRTKKRSLRIYEIRDKWSTLMTSCRPRGGYCYVRDIMRFYNHLVRVSITCACSCCLWKQGYYIRWCLVHVG